MKAHKPRKGQTVVYVGLQPVRCRILEIIPRGALATDYRGAWIVDGSINNPLVLGA